MKKTALSIIALTMAVCSWAQSQMAFDALLFSENEYEGTARTMSMGNAFTALGGDLGSVGLNPAGSAVAGYSQITLTPGLTISTTTTKGIMPPGANGQLPYFDRKMKSSMTNFAFPNLGFTLNFDTHRNSGLKNYTIGFVANKTASQNEDVYANGVNETTSFMASMAYWAEYNGLTGTDLGAEDAYDFMPWKEVVGFRSDMISTYNQHDNRFVGASEIITENEETKESEIFLGGPINQSYGRRVKGDKFDYVLNFGANFSDFIYVGTNIGMTIIDYGYKDYFKESAIDPANFEIGLDDGSTIYFNEMRYKYEYEASGVGYYAKFGVIVTPCSGLRIGAAIQTPTVTAITEEWQNSGETSYTNSGYNASEESPEGENKYRLVSPYRANFGLAYTLGKLGAISADYEICNYSRMKFKSSDYDRDYFENINEEIREVFRASHAFRAGIEVKPLAELALRAGYGFTTSPEQAVYKDKDASKLKVQNLSFGIGYNSKKSFFADLAVRKTFLQDEAPLLYDDYLFDAEGEILPNEYTPQILIKKNLWKVALTLGWRF